MVNRLRISECGLRIVVSAHFFLAVFASAQEISVTAKTDSTNYRVGDWIRLTVEAKIPASIESILPAVKDSIGSFEILKVEAMENSEQDSRGWVFTITSFDSGKGYVPPVELAYRVKGDTTQQIARSNSLILDIGSVAVDSDGEIKDIKPPLDAPWKFEDFLPYLIALAVLALAARVYYYWRKKRKQREEAVVLAKPEIPPHQQALYELRELEDKKLWQQGKVKEYYSEATEIVRRFFEGRWGIDALELTSDEIMKHMKNVAESQKVWKEMQSFFITADLVKFAKYNPTVEEHEDELKEAYEIVRAMVPVIPAEKEEVEYAG
jgi:hypothetical protein